MKTLIKSKKFKGYKISQSTNWKGESSVIFSKKMGDTTYSAGSLERLQEMCDDHQEPTERHKKLTELAIKEFGSTT